MILIIDDDETICLSLRLLLKRNGYDAMTAGTPEKALELIRMHSFGLIMMDMNFTQSTSGREGIELLQKTRILCRNTPVILMTAWGSIPLAVEGMRCGAFDFITKPWDNSLLLRRIEMALELGGHSGESQSETECDDFDRCGIIGQSIGLTKVLDTIKRVAQTDASILITGENGTGKEMIAEAVHRNSRRRGAPFIKVNLGGISQSLFESEMFGYRKGAFTGAVADRKGRFELADKGTIFLDEIGDLDISCQVKLLRVLQEHTFEPLGESRQRKTDIRVVCATNADLPRMVTDRTFREDLFYRINLITVELPPLRDRREDIPLLVRHFARQVGENNGIGDPVITDEALEFLSGLSYPGNIRELKNLVERTIIVEAGSTVYDADAFRRHATVSGNGFSGSQDGRVRSALESQEQRTIEQAIADSGGNLTKAASALGITRQTLYRRMEKYGLKT